MNKTPHQLTDKTKLLHKVSLIHNNQVLILKRANDALSRPGKWDLAGGNSEWPDNSQHGHNVHKVDIAREIMEETGIKLSPNLFDFSSLVYFDTFFDSKKQVFTIICGWKYQLSDNFDKNSIQISKEHSQIKWIDKNQIEEIDFGGDKGSFVKNIVERSLL